MNHDIFYKHLRRGDRVSRLLQGILLAVLLAAAALIALASNDPFITRGDILPFFPVMQLDLIALILVRRFYVKAKKALYKKYNALPEDEKREVAEELGETFQHIRFGKRKFYFYQKFYFHFIDYTDIAWAFVLQRTASQPQRAGADGMLSETPASLSSLVIYDRKGKRFLINVAGGEVTLDKLKAKSPLLISGYSKARQALAKRDFERFLIEGGDL